MKNIICTLIVFATLSLQAQTLKMSDETSDVTFVSKHLAGRLEGSFKGAQGSAQFNPADLAHSYFKFLFAAATAQSNDPTVGPNFVQQGCFYPEKYPSIELSSKSITKLATANRYMFNGSLKIKGVSRFIAFPMTVTPNAGGYDFTFSFTFRKKDFNVKCGTGKDFTINVRTYAKQV
jgi:polyisoprenoid-binding protein YceI